PGSFPPAFFLHPPTINPRSEGGAFSMPATATEKFSGKGRGVGINQGDSAIRIFDVIGVASEDAAIAAVASTFSVAINSRWSTGSPLLATQIYARVVSPGQYEVSAQYSIPTTGQFNNPDPNDPLNQPTVIQWQTVIREEPFDRDVKGKPI